MGSESWWGRSRRAPLLSWSLAAVVVACLIKILFFGGFGILIMTPGQGDFCKSPDGIAVNIRWLAINRDGTKFIVYGLPSGMSPVLWRQAGRMGALRTEPWFTEGVSIVMTSPEGYVLARRTMTAVRCPGT